MTSVLLSIQTRRFVLLTVDTSVVRLDVDCLDLAAVNFKGISLASWASKNGTSIKSQVQCFSELCSWVSKEANLESMNTNDSSRTVQNFRNTYS